MQASIAKGEPVPDGRATVAGLIAQWLDAIRVSKRPKTIQFYELLSRLHITPEIGNVRLSKLEPRAVQALLNRKSKELSAGTTQHIRTTLRAALNFGIKNRMIAYNAASHVEVPNQEHEVEPLTAEQATHLLKAAENTPIGAMLVLGVRLGLRRGELLGLQWPDVNFDDRTLNIVRSIQRIPGQPLEAAPLKTKKSRRTISLPEEVIRTLHEHRAHQARQRLAATEWHPMDLIFANSIGKPLEPRRVDTLFKQCLKRAGLPQSVRVHDMRHTAAALLLEQGADLFSVSRLLGHASIQLTSDVYGHLTKGGNQRLTAQMNAVMPAR